MKTTDYYVDPETEFLESISPQRSGIDERAAQNYIIDYLVSQNRFVYGNRDNISPKTAIDFSTLLQFIQTTQKDAWEFFVKRYGENAAVELEHLVLSEKAARGTLALLREGIPANNDSPNITLMYNTSYLNKDLMVMWEKNIFTIYDEVKFENIKDPKKRIDLVIAVNGIPIQAIELKNELTGQSSAHAEKQFQLTRSNKEPLLQPGLGCLTFFSMSSREVAFATVLRGESTKFLPFNKGKEDGSRGNPPVDDYPEYNGFRTHYMMDEIWTRECLTDLLFNFMFVSSDKPFSQLTLDELDSRVIVVFPRYHQIRLVRNIVRDIQAGNIDPAYLIQHSAGSGKTYSIAWLSQQLIRILNGEGKPQYDHVIIVTDRVAIVTQLEEAIRSLNKHDGLIADVSTSADIRKAILSGKRIIVSTIQKFGQLKRVLDSLLSQDKRYAVLVDEAHSGQSGENAASLIDVLSKSLADDLAENFTQLRRSENITFFAFTATPKPETLAKFGKNNKPCDLYSMRQAIEEGQILNVLKNYMKHEIFNKIHNTGEDTTLPSSIYAKRALNNYIRSSKENLEYKVAVILEHMVSHTLHNINGLGRGMVVVSSREDVRKYFNEMNRQIAENPERYGKVRPMAAFTMSLSDGVTDKALNGFDDSEIPRRLSIVDENSEERRNLLIVADKYQTGFDEPLLCSMYVDKKLSGINAVQTLNRLNRIRKENDKENVTVVDFQDNEDAIREAFAKYDVEARVKTYATLTDIAASALALYAYKLFSEKQVSEYYELFLSYNKARANKNNRSEASAAAVRMSNIVNSILDNTEKYSQSEENEDKEFLSRFESEARNFLEDFVFVSQFQTLTNKNLKGLYLVVKLLLRLLASPRTSHRSEWLNNIEIEIAHTRVTSSSIVLPEQNNSSLGTVREHVHDGRNPNDYDRPITLQELVDAYNNKLKEIFFSASGIFEPNEYGEYTREQLEEYDFSDLLMSIVEEGLTREVLISAAKHRSSKRFISEETVNAVKPIILNALLRHELETQSNEEVDLAKIYNDSDLFAKQFNEYVLSIIYQKLQVK